MTFRPLAFAVVVAFAAGLIGCGGGGGGGNNGSGGTTGAAFTAILLPANASFPGARISTGASGIAYGTFFFGGNNNRPHALAWNTATGGLTDFHPGAYLYSSIVATDGVQQVGNGVRTDDPNGLPRGLIWTNSQSGAKEILPPGWDVTALNGVDAGFQVGQVSHLNQSGGDAAVFNGTSASFVNLMPAGYFSSEADCISGNMIGGIALPVGPADVHAALWTSHDASSFIDMHDAAFETTRITGISGNQQVGVGTLSGGSVSHALMWTGTPGSVVDMNPSGIASSGMTAVSNGVQVGVYETNAGDVQKACYWLGTANSMADLDHYITSAHIGSVATWVDAEGNVYGNVLLAGNAVQGVMWKKNP